MLGSLQGQRFDDIDRSTEEVDTALEKAREADGDSERERLTLQSLSMARSLHYDGGIARGATLMGTICARTGRTSEALQYYLEAEAKLETIDNGPALLSVQTALGDLFFHEKLYTAARRYYEEVLQVRPKDYVTKEKAADASLYDMHFDSAEIYYKELIIKYREEGN
ncbi:MAG: Tetratricopeptide repeat, partial [Bacteroidota bacterium]